MRAGRKLAIAALVVLFIVAAALIATLGRMKRSVGSVSADAQPGAELRELFPEYNHGDDLIRNACGSVGSRFFELLAGGEYGKIEGALDKELLERKYRYCVDQERFSEYLSGMAKAVPDGAVFMLSGVEPAGVTEDAVVATYYAAAPDAKASDSSALDYSRTAMIQLTVYFDGNGKAASILPCPEAAIDAYAYSMGLYRK